MIITYPINSAQADALFAENAVMMDCGDVIYDYRIAGLFGPEVCAWAESCMSFDGYMKAGRDWNSWGGCHCNYFTREGYRKIVSHHNYLLSSKESDECEGGKIWRDLWQARSERLDAAEREEDRKREERKAKRAAARKAKEEAQKKEREAAV